MSDSLSTDGLNMSGLFGFEALDLSTGDVRDAVADTFNKIGEVRGNAAPADAGLDTSGLLGFEHLDKSLHDAETAVADAYNKIGENVPR